jgi:hypothetical protein
VAAASRQQSSQSFTRNPVESAVFREDGNTPSLHRTAGLF